MQVLTKPPLPAYVVLPTRDLISHYRAEFPMSDQNWHELLTQIFDWFMEVGMTAWPPPAVITSLLTPEPIFETQSVTAMANQLYQQLRIRLRSYTQNGLLPLDGTDFNYGFHSLRGADIVLGHLAPTPNQSRRNL